MDDADLNDRLRRLEIGLELANERCYALSLALSWLLARHPDDDVLWFLRSQANEFEDSGKFQECVDEFDDLCASVVAWRAQWSSVQSVPRS